MSRRATIIIPTLNEEARIGGLLAQLSRLPGALVSEILVADGRSADATRALVAEAARADTRVRLIDNPDRLQSAGVNRAVAAAAAGADTIVRIDAHALYPDDYVPRILDTFARTGADMVATRLDTRGETCAQRGIAAAQNSRVGSGGSAHRAGGYSGWIDHGHHAGMDRAMFVRVGGYDESFAANEDAELDLRVRRAGGRIWMAGDIEAMYFPRRTLGALFRQYRRYGAGRAGTYLKHGERLRVRQMLPPAIVVAVTSSVLITAVTWWALAVPALYVVALGMVAVGLFAKARSVCTLFAAPAMAMMHIAWGIGFLTKLIGTRPQPRRVQSVAARQPNKVEVSQ